MDEQLLVLDTNDKAEFTFPSCTFEAPNGKLFDGWEYYPKSKTFQILKAAVGDTCEVTEDITVYPVWKEHTPHVYSTEWQRDENNHWKECECGGKSEEAAHSIGWIIDKPATKEETGLKHGECSVCKYKNDAVVIDKLTDDHVHNYISAWINDETNHWKICECGDKSEKATHTFDDGKVNVEGKKIYTCTVCGKTSTVAPSNITPETPQGGKTTTVIKVVMNITAADLETKTPEELNKIAQDAIAKAINDAVGDGVPFTSAKTTLDIKINAGDVAFAEGTDYTVAYKNNVNANSDTNIVVKFIGDYKKLGTVTQPFKINPASVLNEKFAVADITFTDK